MSKNPWPLKAITMFFASPFLFASSALSIAAFIACVVSGAGTMPSALAKRTPASKTALNAITLAFTIELESTNIKVNAACPGHTATDLNNFAGPRTVEQAAREPVRLALLGPDGPTGTFSNEDGPLPW